MWMPSSDQPCDAALALSSSAVSESVMYMQDSPAAKAFEQELEAQRGFARTGMSFHEMNAVCGQSASQ